MKNNEKNFIGDINKELEEIEKLDDFRRNRGESVDNAWIS